MKKMVFTSLSDLNNFLASEGLPGLDEATIAKGLAESGIPGFSSFSLNSDEEGVTVTPENDDDQHDAAVAFSLDQISMLMRQRDEARELAEAEHRAHMQCHEGFKEVLHQVRIQGYAEAMAAGVYPGKPFETLPEDVQTAIMRQATADIEKIDEIRGGLNKPTIN